MVQEKRKVQLSKTSVNSWKYDNIETSICKKSPLELQTQISNMTQKLKTPQKLNDKTLHIPKTLLLPDAAD